MGEGASSYDITKYRENTDYKCFCCGLNKCRLHHCLKKKDIPLEQWFNSDYDKEKAKKTTVVATSKYLAEEKFQVRVRK